LTQHTPNESPALKVASVADDGTDDWAEAAEDLADAEAEAPRPDTYLDELCERLAWWIHTRKLYGAPRRPVSLLGKLRSGTRPLKPGGGPDAPASAELAALYIALIAQPSDGLDRIVFELHYLQRVTNVKAAAAAVGVGRQHWYTLLRGFRRRIHAASREILDKNQAALAEIRRTRE
jgi:hypothetical protein